MTKGGYIYCQHCGSRNDATASFCEFCGNRLDTKKNKTDAPQNTSNTQQNGSSWNRQGPMGGNRKWLFILLPILVGLIAYFFISSGTSTCASNLACAGDELLLNSSVPFGYYNFTVPAGSSGAIVGEFEANVTTTWIVGPAVLVNEYLNGTAFNFSSLPPSMVVSNTSSIYLIANSTTANLDVILPPGYYAFAVWGVNFSADLAVFPNGLNVTT